MYRKFLWCMIIFETIAFFITLVTGISQGLPVLVFTSLLFLIFGLFFYSKIQEDDINIMIKNINEIRKENGDELF